MEEYEEPNKDNVKLGDIFATKICDLIFIHNITEIGESYASYSDSIRFVKADYDKSIIRSNGKLLVGGNVDISLIELIEKNKNILTEP